jgi:hypothetical protein
VDIGENLPRTDRGNKFEKEIRSIGTKDCTAYKDLIKVFLS